MKLKYELQKGFRIKTRMRGFADDDMFEYMWNLTTQQWSLEIDRNYGYSGWRPCKSVKAFRRMLKTAPKGVKFKLIGHYHGCVYGYGSGN